MPATASGRARVREQPGTHLMSIAKLPQYLLVAPHQAKTLALGGVTNDVLKSHCSVSLATSIYSIRNFILPAQQTVFSDIAPCQPDT